MSFARERYKFNHLLNKKIEALYLLDNWHGIAALLSDYAIIMFTIFFAIHWAWLYPVSLFIIASRQRALATLQHEAAHFTLAKNRKLNNLLGSVFSGFLIYQDFNLYLKSHVRKHHAFLGDEKIDPDYRYHIDLGLYNRSPFLQKKLLREWLMLAKYINSYSCYIIKNRIYDALSLTENCKNILIFNTIMLSLFIWFEIIKYYFLFWIIPMLTFYPLIGWFVELSEHYPLVKHNHIDIMMSRNRFSHWLESLFFNIHNENYHLTHHLKPRVPFWNIRRAHFILMSDEIYCKINQAMGGIFLSRNRQETVLRQLLLSIR